MSGELLMIVTSNGALGDSGLPTGAWLEEVAAAVCRDGNLVTGQNPASSAVVARAVLGAVRDLRK